ncbi:hypothetical protein C8J56DRAFT_1171392 [Mycena floridula]|nr:hypothetical protein C8J56DRAFT_1171392 [Mycena floridula]
MTGSIEQVCLGQQIYYSATPGPIRRSASCHMGIGPYRQRKQCYSHTDTHFHSSSSPNHADQD